MSRKLIIGMMDKTVPFWSRLVVPTALQKGGLFFADFDRLRHEFSNLVYG
ncbi:MULTISPECIES: hypothetical protein [Paenibacillus]|nr:hypothetical protein [Paenibacillus polymyxa]WGV33309.1 hypothetical protein MF627_08050 [Paenibacillus polymyxa]